VKRARYAVNPANGSAAAASAERCRLFVEPVHRDDDVLGKRSRAGHAQDLVGRRLSSGVIPPTQARVDDDGFVEPGGVFWRANGVNDAAAVRPQNRWVADAGVLALPNPFIAPVERGCQEPDPRLSGLRLRELHLFDSEAVFTQDQRTHLLPSNSSRRLRRLQN